MKHIPSQQDLTDENLVEGLKKGRQQACNLLVAQYRKRLLKLAYGVTLDMEDSQEIVQDVFVKAIKNIHGFRQESSLWGWLRKITINACLNWKRKWKRRFKWHHTPLASEDDPALYRKPGNLSDPESILREKEVEKKLMHAVGRLKERIRIVFVLNTFEDLSYEEIARELNIRKGTVSSRLHLARKQILNELDSDKN